MSLVNCRFIYVSFGIQGVATQPFQPSSPLGLDVSRLRHDRDLAISQIAESIAEENQKPDLFIYLLLARGKTTTSEASFAIQSRSVFFLWRLTPESKVVDE